MQVILGVKQKTIMTITAAIGLKILTPVILILAVVGVWFLARSIASRSARGVGVFTMALGAVGVALSLFSLFDYSGTKEMHAAALIASSIFFGCGAIVMAIAKGKE